MKDLIPTDSLKNVAHWSYGASLIITGVLWFLISNNPGSCSPLILMGDGILIGMGIMDIIIYFQLKKIIS